MDYEIIIYQTEDGLAKIETTFNVTQSGYMLTKYALKLYNSRCGTLNDKKENNIIT